MEEHKIRKTKKRNIGRNEMRKRKQANQKETKKVRKNNGENDCDKTRTRWQQ